MPKNILKTPIVAVMGHVDHGKTSLLDRIRGTKVTATEAGGITQSVRAHQIVLESNKKITFIDTPGHEAFAGMRSRGAAIANIAVIVVAKDDGVQPQTIQACKFAIEQKLPIIIALNKIDLPGVEEMKIYSQLTTLANVLVEDMGGDAIVCKVSANTGEGIEHLLETILLVNEMHPQEEKSLDNNISEGIVLESSMAKNWGNVALVILKAGLLDSSKDIYASNSEFSSKVRNLLNADQLGTNIVEAGDPVWITGLDKVLNVGQLVRFFNDKISAEKEITTIKEKEEYDSTISLDPREAFKKLLTQQKNIKSDDGKKILNIILKTDTRGSMEVAKNEIEKLSDEFAEIKIMESTEGEITERDIERAKTINAIVIGFRSGTSDAAMRLAVHEKVLVRNYEIIYEMIDELDGALAGLLAPLEEEVEIARGLVKQVFTLSDKSIIAGTVIQKGIFLKGYRIKILRDEEEVAKGKILSLRILKNEVREVQKGQDCGVQTDIKEEIRVGDLIIAYKVEKQ